MRNVIMVLAILGFFFFTTIAAARNHEGETLPSGSDHSPAANSNNSGKPESGAEEISAVESELQDLRDLVQAQSEELRQLRVRLAAVEVGKFASREVASPPGTTTLPSVTDALEAVAAIAPTAGKQGAASGASESRSPLSFKIGAAEFTPGGFLDFTTFFRSTNVGSGIATAFGAIPFNNQLPQGRLSETRLSAQYSRISLGVNAHLTDSTTITGYVESDFLGFQPANAYVTANSDSLRLRVYWADVRHGKWEILGGQAWSLMTPNRVGLSPLPQDIFFTQDEDPNFQVGLTWLRQPQFRVVYHPTNNWAVGVSLENPQQYAPASVVFPASSFISQFDNGSGSTSAPSSATNTTVPNLHPDIIVKAAYDAHPAGHQLHIEAAALLRSFRVFNDFASRGATNTITGGGGSFNLNYEVIHNLRLIGNFFYSDGGGRYIFGLGPDAIIKPDGTLSAVHSGSGVAGFEYQSTPHYMFYAYYGGAYFQRNFGLLPAAPTAFCGGIPSATCVGFGFPGSANTANRAIQEATFGVIPTLWSNENYGRLQIITQYSYLVRSPWSVASGNPKNAHTSMVYTGLRYILP